MTKTTTSTASTALTVSRRRSASAAQRAVAAEVADSAWPSDGGAAEALDVELLMSTHLTIVVRARVELDGDVPGHGSVQDTGLVISRRRCRGDRPSRRALLDAARDCVARMASGAGSAPKAVRRLLARVDGAWQALVEQDTVRWTEAA